MVSENTVIHLLAGGAGGTAGAVATCPLEVIKTRLQSSVATFHTAQYDAFTKLDSITRVCVPMHSGCHGRQGYCTVSTTVTTQTRLSQANSSLRACFCHIYQNEGMKGLFKGLGPNLVGVAPSRAIYFCAYDQTKRWLNCCFTPETPIVHVSSAFVAGFTASTTTNPIWFIKTRVQLDQKRNGSLTVSQCIRATWTESGIRGFYKGITASYWGISETMIHFVIYEAIKANFIECKGHCLYDDEKSSVDFLKFMAAGAVSKTIATCVAYPHEVARTRIRQPGNKYTKFWQTLFLVWKEERVHGLYRGLYTQLLRQIPNTAIMMSTYEAVVYLCSKYMQNENHVY